MKRYPRIHDSLRAIAAAAVVALVATQVEAGGPGVHGRVFALSENGAIDGAVPGARIEIQNQGGGTVATLTAGRGGYYRADLPSGQYRYKVTAEGFKDEDFGRGFALQLGQGYAVYNFSLTRGENDPDHEPPVETDPEIGKLEGRVMEKKPDGELIGIGQAQITLRPGDGRRKLLRVDTRGPGNSADQQGQYGIALAAGTFRASVRAEGFDTLVDPTPIPVADGQTTTRDFILTRQRPETPQEQGIRGRITLAGKPDKPQRTGQISVQIVPVSEPRQTGEPITPGQGGRYGRELTAGRYQVLATAEGYQPARSGPRSVFAGKYTVVNLRLKPVPDARQPEEPVEPPAEQLVFLGTVYEELPSGRGKRPLPGASVLLRAAGQALAEAPRDNTDGQGQVELSVEGAGTYTVLARKDGYKPSGALIRIVPGGENAKNILLAKLDRREPVEPNPPEDRQPPVSPVEPPRVEPVIPEVVLPEAAVLSLRVSGQGSGVLPGAYVVVNQNHRRVTSAKADSRGLVSFRLKPGAYFVGAVYQGYQPAQGTVTLAATSTHREIFLKRSAGVPPVPATEPDTARLPDRVPVLPQPVEPVRPSMAVLNLQIAGVQTQRGRVLQMPLPEAQVKILQNGGLAASGVSDRTGRFTARLKTGAYQIYVAHRDFMPHQGSVSLFGTGTSRQIVLKGRMQTPQTPGNLPSVVPGLQPSTRTPNPPTYERKPPRTLQQPSLRTWQQMLQNANPSAAAANRTHQNGSAGQSSSSSRLRVDPRRLNSQSHLQTQPTHVPSGQPQAQAPSDEEARKQKLQMLLRARQAAVK